MTKLQNSSTYIPSVGEKLVGVSFVKMPNGMFKFVISLYFRVADGVGGDVHSAQFAGVVCKVHQSARHMIVVSDLKPAIEKIQQVAKETNATILFKHTLYEAVLKTKVFTLCEVHANTLNPCEACAQYEQGVNDFHASEVDAARAS